MTRPGPPRSPRWSVLLRVGVGVAVFGLFVMLFTYFTSTLGVVVFGVGVAFLLASLVFYLQDRPARRR